jgi:hypothetical protein
METAANRLQKEAKGYLDSLRGTHILLRTQTPKENLFANLIGYQELLR